MKGIVGAIVGIGLLYAHAVGAGEIDQRNIAASKSAESFQVARNDSDKASNNESRRSEKASHKKHKRGMKHHRKHRHMHHRGRHHHHHRGYHKHKRHCHGKACGGRYHRHYYTGSGKRTMENYIDDTGPDHR